MQSYEQAMNDINSGDAYWDWKFIAIVFIIWLIVGIYNNWNNRNKK